MVSPGLLLAAEILDLRSSYNPKNSNLRLVIETKEKIKYKEFFLTSPTRFIVDIPGATIKNKKHIKNSYITNIRFGKQPKNTLRIVFDLKDKAVVKKKFVMAKNDKFSYRTVFDLEVVKKKDKKSKKQKPKNIVANSKDKPKDVAVRDKAKTKATPTKLKDKSDAKTIQVKKENKKTIAKDASNKKTPPPSVNVNPFEILDGPKKTPSQKTIVQKKIEIVQKKFIVVIDAGHGGMDCGAIGRYYKTYEKNVTLAYAKSLQEALNRNMHYTVYLTRSSDRYLTLSKRADVAKKLKADLFISIHADSHPNNKTRGASIYSLSERAYEREGKKIINQKRKVSLIDNIDLHKEDQDTARVIIDMLRRDVKNNSRHFAKIATEELQKEIKLLKGAHRFAGFQVLRESEIPAVIIELGYLSNKSDEKLLNNSKYRGRVINCLKDAINKYFNRLRNV